MSGGWPKVESAALRYRVDPRAVPAVKAARIMGLTLVAFETALPRLTRRGFPQPDPDTGNFDTKAIDAWMDRQSGLAILAEPVDAAPDFSARLEKLRGTGRQR